MQGPSDFPVLECLYCFGLELFWEFYHCDAGGEHTVLCVSPVFQKWVKSCAPDATAVTLGECSYKDTSNLANSWNNSKHSKFP